MLDLAAALKQVRQGMIPAHIYGDPEIFALERDRLFARAWVFLAHESEIPDPGDYVVRRVLADSFIVARDESGVVRVMFNMAVDAAAPEEFKRNSYRAYLMCFGSSGMFEQDDVENWVSITDMAAGSMARRLNLNSRMGLTPAGQPIKPPLGAFAGPGLAYQGFGEFNQRHWLSLWSDHLEHEPALDAVGDRDGAR